MTMRVTEKYYVVPVRKSKQGKKNCKGASHTIYMIPPSKQLCEQIF